MGTIGVISTQVSGCLAFWVSDDLSNNVWGQVGYYICSGSSPVAFYQVWNLNTYAVLTTGSASVSQGSHTFAMYLQSGTTWAYSLDGSVFGTYDMGSSISSASYPVYALSEENEVSAPFSFPTVNFSNSMEVMSGGSWNYVQTAASYGSGWGVQGNSQNPNISPDSTLVGGSLPGMAQGSTLWNGIPSSTTTTSTTSTTYSTTTSSTSTTYTISATTTASSSQTTTRSTTTSSSTTTATTSTASTTTATVSPPTASISSPANCAYLSGTAAVKVSATSSIGITKIELYVDGSLYATSSSPSPTFQLDTTKSPDGPLSLYAVAFDTSGDSGTSATVSVNVDNTPPAVSITGPTQGSTVSGTVTISASASDSRSGLRSVQFLVDGGSKATVTSTPYQYQWNTKNVKTGWHTITVIAIDNAGISAQTSLTVYVQSKR